MSVGIFNKKRVYNNVQIIASNRYQKAKSREILRICVQVSFIKIHFEINRQKVTIDAQVQFLPEMAYLNLKVNGKIYKNQFKYRTKKALLFEMHKIYP